MESHSRPPVIPVVQSSSTLKAPVVNMQLFFTKEY